MASNLSTHLTLRSLRPAGSKKRVLPKGYGFNLVAVPNYLFESLEWIAFTLMTGSASGTFKATTMFSFSSPPPQGSSLVRGGEREKERQTVADTSRRSLSAAALFTAISVGQMIPWALKKKANYKKEFPNEFPKGKKAIFPFLI